MARIEYLINNPKEVELNDLDLLNSEIEKFPYFYSLRALKLLALKKLDHSDYEKELQLTSIYNNDRKGLYTLLHPKHHIISTAPAEDLSETNEQQLIQEVEFIQKNNQVESLLQQDKLINEDIVESVEIESAPIVEEIADHIAESSQEVSTDFEENNFVSEEVILEDATEEVINEIDSESINSEEEITNHIAESSQEISTDFEENNLVSEEVILEDATEEIINKIDAESINSEEEIADHIAESSQEISTDFEENNLVSEEVILEDATEEVINEIDAESINSEEEIADHIAESSQEISTDFEENNFVSEEVILEDATEEIINEFDVESINSEEEIANHITESLQEISTDFEENNFVSEEVILEDATEEIINEIDSESINSEEEIADHIAESSQEISTDFEENNFVSEEVILEDATEEIINEFDAESINSEEEIADHIAESSPEISTDFEENTSVVANELESTIESYFTENTAEDLIEETIISEPTIESIIEDFKLQENSVTEEEVELVNFDYPTSEVNEVAIENSLEILQEILDHDSIISKAIEETKELSIPVINEVPTIEQVELINRSKEVISSEPNSGEIVSTITPFQVLNTRNEIKGGFDQVEKLMEEILSDDLLLAKDTLSTSTDFTSISPSLHEEEISEKEIIDSLSPETATSVEVQEENATLEAKDEILAPIQTEEITELKKDTESIPSAAIDSNKSFSFNDWLKIPSVDPMETQTEKEQKYQIIDDFLEKNPKIKPLKKQEVPESKAEVKDLKTTDFSDLMTETLAQIYIEQKQYEKAIKAYKILILKYPEKNSLFANQIKEIENLKNSK